MPCFCDAASSQARQSLNMGITPLLPPPPLSMKLALALPALTPDNRLDMQINAGFDPARLPSINFGGGGGLMQIAMTLSLMAGTFTLDDLPTLELEMAQASESLMSNVWPRLGWLTTLKIQPLLNFTIVARLALDLQALGIDPFNIESFPDMAHGASPNLRFALTPPKLAMARFVAALPNLLSMNAALNLPPLGEQGGAASSNTLSDALLSLSNLQPPSLAISMPALQKLALVMQSLATIQEAFGPGAFLPPMFPRIERMLAVWASMRLPMPPLDAIALHAKLEALPSMEDIQLGEQIAGSSSMAAFGAGFSPPKLAFAPFLNVVLALNGSFQMALEIDPFDMCSMCPCA